MLEGYLSEDGTGTRRKVLGIGGSFSYARVGEPLFSEYKDWGAKPPSFERLAEYVWYTETSTPIDKKDIDPKTGKIGEWRGASYYLLYDPGTKQARALDLEWLGRLKDENRRKVVYCEKIWLHRDELPKYGDEVRPMLVPFNVK